MGTFAGSSWGQARPERTAAPAGQGTPPSCQGSSRTPRPPPALPTQLRGGWRGLFCPSPWARATAPALFAERPGRPPLCSHPRPACRRGSDGLWGLLACPPSTPGLAPPSSALTIAPESPARDFLLPVARGQLRRRARDAKAWPPRRAGSARGSRSCHGAQCQRPFSVSPETLPGNDRRQPI